MACPKMGSRKSFAEKNSSNSAMDFDWVIKCVKYSLTISSSPTCVADLTLYGLRKRSMTLSMVPKGYFQSASIVSASYLRPVMKVL